MEQQVDPQVQPPREKLIRAINAHWMKYVRIVLTGIVLYPLFALLFFLAIFYTSVSPWIFYPAFFNTLLILLLIHHWFFYRILGEAMRDMVVTNQRFISLYMRLFISDEMREYSMRSIRAVEGRQKGILQNVLGYGSLWFDTGGSELNAPGTHVEYVPQPQQMAQEITALLTQPQEVQAARPTLPVSPQTPKPPQSVSPPSLSPHVPTKPSVR